MRMNVPENLVRNPQRQSAIREFKARVREETPESPSRWLPIPPVTLSSVKKQRRRVESSASGCSMVTIIIMTRDFFYCETQLYFTHSIKCVEKKLHGVCLLNLVLCFCSLLVYVSTIFRKTYRKMFFNKLFYKTIIFTCVFRKTVDNSTHTHTYLPTTI